MGIRFKKEALIAGCVIAFFILLSLLFLADYLRPKNALFKGLFKCAECAYAFRKEVSSKVRLPLACLKCGKKTALLAGEFFCSHCQKNYVINLEIPPWEEKEKGESLDNLYQEALAYTLQNKKAVCPVCRKELTARDKENLEDARERLNQEKSEFEERS